VLVTATQLKNNMGKYLALAQEEDIVITRNGANVAKLTSLRRDRAAAARSLFGIIPEDSLAGARDERMARYESAD
jgi:prevent-host-death family protein